MFIVWSIDIIFYQSSYLLLYKPFFKMKIRFLNKMVYRLRNELLLQRILGYTSETSCSRQHKGNSTIIENGYVDLAQGYFGQNVLNYRIIPFSRSELLIFMYIPSWKFEIHFFLRYQSDCKYYVGSFQQWRLHLTGNFPESDWEKRIYS